MNYGNCKLCNKPFHYNNLIYRNNIIKLFYCEKCVAKERKKELKEKTIMLIKNLFSDSNIPKLKQSITLDALIDYPELHKNIIKQLNFWIKNRKNHFNGPFFYGNSGIGKTTLAFALANHFIRNEQINVFYLNVPSLLNLIKNYIQNNLKIDSLIKKTISCDIAIIDDLSYNINNINNVQLLYSIVENRLQQKKTTIITSQISPNDLLKINNNQNKQLQQSTKALIDRCIELCNPIAIGTMDSPSIRLLKAKKRINNFKLEYELSQ